MEANAEADVIAGIRIKEVEAHFRHSRATTTLDISVQEIPEEVRAAVESLDAVLANATIDKTGGKTN